MMKVNLAYRELPRLNVSSQKPALWQRVLLLVLTLLFVFFCLGFLTEANAATSKKKSKKRAIAQALEKNQILKDSASRIAPEFHVPKGLEKRVAFWFDVYSKYTATDHVIHYLEYPWIVFDVVSTKDIPDNPRNRWAKFHASERLVKNERARVRKLLLKLSKKKNLKNLSAEEQKIVNLLKEVPGKRSKVFRHAANNLRTQLGQKDFIVAGLTNSRKYLPRIEQTFEERGLPLELTRLPLVESSFNEAAVSKVGASGIWQLMPPIGKKFLYMSDYIDERNSPLKAADAAARLLEQNYKILKTWPLALTAYNHGPGGLLKAQKKLKTNDITAIVNDYSSTSFGFASSNFYCSFVAALHVEKYQKEIFGELAAPESTELHIVELPKSLEIKKVAAVLEMHPEEVQSFNLDIKDLAVSKNRRLPRGYRLFVPAEKRAQLEAYFDSLPQDVTQGEGNKKNPRL